MFLFEGACFYLSGTYQLTVMGGACGHAVNQRVLNNDVFIYTGELL